MESSDATAQAIEQLYCLYDQPVLHYLERLVQQHESAEDLCQETFLAGVGLARAISLAHGHGLPMCLGARARQSSFHLRAPAAAARLV